jgi:secreted trypsin-like serine protease
MKRQLSDRRCSHAIEARLTTAGNWHAHTSDQDLTLQKFCQITLPNPTVVGDSIPPFVRQGAINSINNITSIGPSGNRLFNACTLTQISQDSDNSASVLVPTVS